MNRNVLIVLAGGFLIAVLVALLVQATLSGGEKEEEVVVKEEPKVQIIVAAAPLSRGDTLNEENIKWQDWPKSAVFEGAVVREGDLSPLDMLSGRLRRDVAKGEPVMNTAVFPEDSNLLSVNLEPGLRAFSIDVKASDMVAGFVGPGDHVDIMLTYRETVSYNGPRNPMIDAVLQNTVDSLATETIMENVKVLAVDQAAARGEGAARIGKTVTLEVDRKGAEVLALADEIGDLSLALRGVGDDRILGRSKYITTDERVVNLFEEVQTMLMKMQNAPSQKPKIVRIYSGGSVEELAVQP